MGLFVLHAEGKAAECSVGVGRGGEDGERLWGRVKVETAAMTLRETRNAVHHGGVAESPCSLVRPIPAPRQINYRAAMRATVEGPIMVPIPELRALEWDPVSPQSLFHRSQAEARHVSMPSSTTTRHLTGT